jgi:hypothetical protein
VGIVVVVEIEEGFLTYVTRRAGMRREEKAGSLRFGMTGCSRERLGWRFVVEVLRASLSDALRKTRCFLLRLGRGLRCKQTVVLGGGFGVAELLHYGLD